MIESPPWINSAATSEVADFVLMNPRGDLTGPSERRGALWFAFLPGPRLEVQAEHHCTYTRGYE